MGSLVIVTAPALWAPRGNLKSRSRQSHFTAQTTFEARPWIRVGDDNGSRAEAAVSANRTSRLITHGQHRWQRPPRDLAPDRCSGQTRSKCSARRSHSGMCGLAGLVRGSYQSLRLATASGCCQFLGMQCLVNRCDPEQREAGGEPIDLDVIAPTLCPDVAVE
jgi:hypothetical protein